MPTKARYPYTITLSSDERLAVDWIGNRYAWGSLDRYLTPISPEDAEWADGGDITFGATEADAWQIRDMAEEDSEGGHSPWPCAAPELAAKLQRLVDSIV